MNISIEIFQLSPHQIEVLLKEHLVGKCSGELSGVPNISQFLFPKINCFMYGCNPPFLGGCTRQMRRPSGASMVFDLHGQIPSAEVKCPCFLHCDS